MSRVCTITGKGPRVGNRVSHSNIKTKMRQLPNLQVKRLWVPEIGQFMRLRLSTRALRSIAKLGFVQFCEKNGIAMREMIAHDHGAHDHSAHDHSAHDHSANDGHDHG